MAHSDIGSAKVEFADGALNELLKLSLAKRSDRVSLFQARAWERQFPDQLRVVDGVSGSVQFFGTFAEWQERLLATNSPTRRVPRHSGMNV